MKVIAGNWNLTRLKWLCRINRSVISEKTDPDYEIDYLDIGNVDGNGVIQGTEKLTFAKAPSRARRIVKHGETIVSTVRTYLRAITGIFNPPENLIVSTGFAVLTPEPEMEGRFLNYSCRSEQFIHSVISNSTGVSYPAINPSELANLEIAHPPRPQQIAIADFLDQETARIDALIAKEEQLLALLEEKRTALISHAVTKGLDPNAELKDSGVDWLGMIPKGWDVVKFKRIVRIAEGQVDPRDAGFSGLQFVGPEHIEKATGRIINAVSVADVQAISGKYFAPAGCVIYSKIRPELRKVCIVLEDSLCSADMYPLLCTKRIKEKFLFYWLLSEAFSRKMIDESMRVAMPKVNREVLGNTFIPLPDVESQKHLVILLEERLARFDALKTKITRAIELLREKRTALISAAVTSKIEMKGGSQ